MDKFNQTILIAISVAIATSCASPGSHVALVPGAFQFYGDVRGCGDFRVFRFTDDGTKALGVGVDKLGLAIAENPQTFDLETTKGIEVFIDDFGTETYEGRGGYCYDALIAHQGQTQRFEATKGRVTIWTTKNDELPFYDATVLLEDVTFANETRSIEFVIPRMEIRDVMVGWIPG